MKTLTFYREEVESFTTTPIKLSSVKWIENWVKKHPDESEWIMTHATNIRTSVYKLSERNVWVTQMSGDVTEQDYIWYKLKYVQGKQCDNKAIHYQEQNLWTRCACPTVYLYSVTNIVINTFKDKTMTIQKQITDIPVAPNATPTNITVTPINIILPQRLPQRDNNVWLTSPIKTTPL